MAPPPLRLLQVVLVETEEGLARTPGKDRLMRVTPVIFKVATFCDDFKGAPVKSRIRAYTSWYSPEWAGAVVHEVSARSGAEAKRIAIDLRLAMEVASCSR